MCAGTYVLFAFPRRLLFDGVAAHVVTGVRSAFRADTSQIYPRWGNGAPGAHGFCAESVTPESTRAPPRCRADSLRISQHGTGRAIARTTVVAHGGFRREKSRAYPSERATVYGMCEYRYRNPRFPNYSALGNHIPR